MKQLIFFISLSLILILINSCKQAETTVINSEPDQQIFKPFGDQEPYLLLSLTKGKAHNHPSLAIWMEDMQGQMIQTLFVTKSVATGFYNFGDAGNGKWLKTPGVAKRPASLPYWLHRRELALNENQVVPSREMPVPDAYTGATPVGSFSLKTLPLKKIPEKFRLFIEVNQPWDWNAYWNNTKYEGNADYRSSAQPSLIYAVTVDTQSEMKKFYLNPVGHGHYAGEDGKLYTNISTLTTAKNIFDIIMLQIGDNE
ncbi:MAG: hypothetical protein KJ578_09895 [Bacteroidetes bacterium]|nr:hypothetical protein [Bacteroidota bacterium]MBU1579001.1 hypothetical protein [Bacteroidota bacterium]MBU2466359.1 hypothetical protein [Bacteroidota bacterium]MBU2558077.1 hypothetical protein [Bacteroidota bacterium]